MESLFTAAHNQKIIHRINSLSPSSKALWGKMNVSQMLAHCQIPLKVAHGETKIKRGLLSILFGTFVKNKLTKDDKAFDRNLPTNKKLIIIDEREFETEKHDLISLVEKFHQLGPNGLTKHPHPFFGRMNEREWDTLQWKHLDHHLRQFGV